jgi:lipopolysaccharide biosynthesis protein
MTTDKIARLIAFYLPQYHPIPENDAWWGKGFTEWTNVGKARPLFPGHYQPHVPADLGYYDLRVPEIRDAQAEMARKYGIEGFCYYHYWFGNERQLIERPFQEVLKSGKPDFPFCLCWANDTWTGIWHGSPGRILIKQEYPGPSDDDSHFAKILPAFNDERYIRIDGKPVFAIWKPFDFPDPRQTVERWQSMARGAGLPGLHLIGIYRPGGKEPEDYGYDASIYNNNPPIRGWGSWRTPHKLIYNKLCRLLRLPTVVDYKRAIPYFLPKEAHQSRYPSVTHAWDNTPRSGVNGLVFKDATPELFRDALNKAINLVKDRPIQNRLVFLKSWNEWAEGNHLEPDLKYGHGFLQAIKDEIHVDH